MRKTTLRKCFHLSDHGFGFLRRKRFQRIQFFLLAEFGHTRGNDGNVVDGGIHTSEVVHRSCELFPIVDAFAKYDLAIHLRTCLSKTLHITERACRLGILQHRDTQLGIGRMHGDIDGRHLHLDDTGNIVIGEIGHRDIIAL